METIRITCGSCGLAVGAVILAGQADQYGNPVDGYTQWLQCPSCGEGSVMLKNGTVQPVAPVGRQVEGLPDDVKSAWREAGICHNAGAFTASEMMCRKILMHIAVDKVQADQGKSFAEYIDILDSAGYITTGLRSVVDLVRQRGNIANHELPPSDETSATVTVLITRHLLVAVYELPMFGQMAAPEP